MGTDRDGSGISIRVVLAALVVLGGVFYVQQRPYVGVRPPVTELQQSSPVDFQDVDARLWEDPFTAVDRRREEEKQYEDKGKQVGTEKKESRGQASQGARAKEGSTDQVHTSEWLAKQILEKRPKKGTDKPPVVLGVMVFGGPHLERIEHRRRMRYAVLAGLNVSGFEPAVEDHIGYIKLSLDGKPECGPGETRPQSPASQQDKLLLRPREVFVPFEWFRSSTPRRELLLLWLDEIALRSRPVTYLNEIVGQLTVSCGHSLPKIPVAVIGPAASSTLARMVRWIGSPEFLAPEHLQNMLLYSASATAPAKFLSADLPPDKALKDEADLRHRFNEKEIRFLRTIATDDKVIETLREELCRRGIRLEKCHPKPAVPDQVVLVSEWDTLYSRSLAHAVKKSFCGSQVCPTVDDISYLSGLEGVAPGGTSGQSGEKDRAGEKAKREARDTPWGLQTEALERAEGNSQFDYLRRLVTRIRDKQWDLRGDGQSIRAIGILGNHPYDKLLVLQALRADFPGVQFFTTDLDARFLHPSDTRRTRNLLVGTSFGLEMDRASQGRLPPFRDSYQTSTFLATQLAIKGVEGCDRAGVVPAAVDRWFGRTPPRLFEIGRTAAVDLSMAAPGGSPEPEGEPDRSGCTPNELLLRANVHPNPYSYRPPVLRSASWALPAIGLVGALLVYAWSWTMRAALAAAIGRSLAALRKRPLRSCGILAIVVLSAAWLAFGAWAVVRNSGEPFAVFEGVSVWPSEILRALALVLNAVFLILVVFRMKACTAELSDRFFPGYQMKALRYEALKSWGTWRRMFAGPQAAHRGVEPVSAESLWMEHAFQASPLAVWIRVLTMALLFVGLAGLVMVGVFPRPIKLMRAAQLRQWGDIALIIGSTVLFILLVSWIVDAIRLCDKFAQALSRRDRTELARRDRTEWAAATRERALKELGVPKTGEAAVSSWVSVQLIARWTAMIGPLVYYPFATLGLMVVARSTLLANWDMPPGLYIVFGLSAAYMMIAAHTLRRLAERTRRLALENLDNEIVAATGRESDRGLASQIKLLRENVERMRDGAFAPFTHQPIMKAFLVPIMSYGGLALVEYLMRS